MKTEKLSEKSIDELWSLHEQVVCVLSQKIVEEKARLEKRLTRLNIQNAGKLTRRPYPAVRSKFCNPAQPSERWSGRGKQPLWLRAQLRSGKKLDDFLIQKN